MGLTSSNFIKPQVRLCVPTDSEQTLGGGWTFRRNLIKALKSKIQIVDRIEDSNVVLISSPTMVTRETINKIKELGKKLVLRLDNVPRNSRNRNTGTTRLFDFAQVADQVVFQSLWSMEYLAPFINKIGPVIYNGVDTEIFKKDGPKIDFHGSPVYLYSRFNRDETKSWEKAWYKYQMLARKNKDAILVIVGNFSPEQVEYNFDFFMGEKYVYQGIIDNPEEMAKIMRGCNYFLATYYNDCYSNTYQEAIACGVELFEPDMSGGTPELLENDVVSLEQMGNQYLKVFEEVLAK